MAVTQESLCSLQPLGLFPSLLLCSQLGWRSLLEPCKSREHRESRAVSWQEGTQGHLWVMGMGPVLLCLRQTEGRGRLRAAQNSRRMFCTVSLVDCFCKEGMENQVSMENQVFSALCETAGVFSSWLLQSLLWEECAEWNGWNKVEG